MSKDNEWPMFQNIREAAKTIKEMFMSKTAQNPEEMEVTPQSLPNKDFECCSDWAVQIDILNSPIVMQTVRSGFKWQYPGKKFAYCPWCGTKRL